MSITGPRQTQSHLHKVAILGHVCWCKMPPLLFINKTQSSEVLTRSFRADEKSRILSHVQNRRRKNEAKRKRNARAESQHVESHVDTDTQPNPETCNEKKDKEYPHIASISTYHPSHNSSDPFYSTVAGQDIGCHAMLHLTFSQGAKTTFLSEAFAPPSMYGFLPNMPMRHDRVMQARLRRCIQDPLLMYATLAYGSSCLAWMFGVFEPSRPPEYFLVKAISLARKRVANLKCWSDKKTSSPPPRQSESESEEEKEEKQWLALSIYSLAITESWNDMSLLWTRCPPRQALALTLASPSQADNFSVAAAETHLRALVKFVSCNGGWEAFDPYLLESVVLATKYKSLWAMERPVLKLGWEPGAVPPVPVPVSVPLSGAATANGTETKLGLELGKHLLRLPLLEELKTIIADIAEYTRIARAAWSSFTFPPHPHPHPSSSPLWNCTPRPFNPGSSSQSEGQSPSQNLIESSPLQNWLFLRLQSFSHRLMHLPSALLSPFDEAIRIVVLCFLLTATNIHGPAIMAETMASRIKLALAKSQFWGSDCDGDGGRSLWTPTLRFWCLCIGAIAAGRTTEREWFLDRISDLYMSSEHDKHARGELRDHEDDEGDEEVEESLDGYLFLWDSHGLELSVLLEQLPPEVALYCQRTFVGRCHDQSKEMMVEDNQLPLRWRTVSTGQDAHSLSLTSLGMPVLG